MAGPKTSQYILPALLAVGGGAMLYRGLRHPWRAFARSGRVAKCPGGEPGKCNPATLLEVAPGSPIYAPVRCLAVKVTDDSVVLLTDGAPTLLGIVGIVPSVELNDPVVAGQEVGTAEQRLVGVSSVLMLPEDSQGNLRHRFTPTAAWAASRGCRLLEVDEGSSGWCIDSRDIRVPADVASGCDFASPGTPSYSLLPVRIDFEG